MYLKEYKLVEFGDGFAMIKAKVKLTEIEARKVKDGDEDVIADALEVGGCKQSYYAGVGRGFVGEPGWRLQKNNVMAITQRAGYDI